MIIHVEITQPLIDNNSPCNGNYCMVAEALRHVGVRSIFHVFSDWISFCSFRKKRMINVPLPTVAVKAIVALDRQHLAKIDCRRFFSEEDRQKALGVIIEPFSFDLDVPDWSLT